MFVYVLDVDVYRDADEQEWLTGITAVYTSSVRALERLKLWCLDNYLDPAEVIVGMYTGEYFTGNSVEVSMEDETVYLSFGINRMEVHE